MLKIYDVINPDDVIQIEWRGAIRQGQPRLPTLDRAAGVGPEFSMARAQKPIVDFDLHKTGFHIFQ